MPPRPRSADRRIVSTGKCSSRSHCTANGTISRSAKSRLASTMASWSAERSNTGVPPAWAASCDRTLLRPIVGHPTNEAPEDTDGRATSSAGALDEAGDAAELAAIGLRCGAHRAGEVMSQDGGAAEADGLRDPVDRQIGRLQQLP